MVRKRDPAKTQRILDAAAGLFAERHYHAVRMEDIAARAGVAKGTLYLHFQDKESLYLGLIRSGSRRLYEEVKGKIGETGRAEDKLLVFVREVIRFFERYPYFLDLVQRVEVAFPESRLAPLRASRQQFHDLLAGVLQELPGAGGPAPCVELGTLALLGMIRGILRFHARPWGDRLAEWIVRCFLYGITSPGR